MHPTCCRRQKSCEAQPICTGERKSASAIQYLVQKKHSTYDASHDSHAFLRQSLHNLVKYYAAVDSSDVLLWHGGDFVPENIPALELPVNVNVRLCLLDCCSGWGPPPGLEGEAAEAAANGRFGFAPGYLFMIRFHAITMWRILESLGYNWVMRMDDDGAIMSPIKYNIFENMMRSGIMYGWRSESTLYPLECTALGHFLKYDFCANVYSGPYNNWFVANVQYWLRHEVHRMQRLFDASAYIFENRTGDLPFHTMATQVLFPAQRVHRFTDFTYEHLTVKEGLAYIGGIEFGLEDPKAVETATRYVARWNNSYIVQTLDQNYKPLPYRGGKSVRECLVRETPSAKFVILPQVSFGDPAVPFCHAVVGYQRSRHGHRVDQFEPHDCDAVAAMEHPSEHMYRQLLGPPHLPEGSLGGDKHRVLSAMPLGVQRYAARVVDLLSNRSHAVFMNADASLNQPPRSVIRSPPALSTSLLIHTFKQRQNVVAIGARLMKYQHLTNETIVFDDVATDWDCNRARWGRDLRNAVGDWRVQVLHTPNLHEIRAYNLGIDMTHSDLVVIMQGDDLPPASGEWLENAITLFQELPDLAVLGGLMGIFLSYPVRSMEIGDMPSYNYPMTWPLPFTMKGIPFSYVGCAPIGPIILRRSFMKKHYPHFDVRYSARGEPGILLDCDVSYTAWQHGWTTGVYPAPFARGVGGHQSKNSVARNYEREQRRQQNERYIFQKFKLEELDARAYGALQRMEHDVKFSLRAEIAPEGSFEDYLRRARCFSYPPKLCREGTECHEPYPIAFFPLSYKGERCDDDSQRGERSVRSYRL